MVSMLPFPGYRPPARHAPEVCSPPYDVISDEDARRIASSRPYSFIRVVKPEVDFPPRTDPFSDAVYTRGAENLRALIRTGRLVRDTSPAFYIYRLTWKGRSQVGIVGTAAVDDYDRGVIKRHETTRPDREEDRTRFIVEQRAHAGPVFLFHRERKSLAALVNDYLAGRGPEVRFTSCDGVTHSLWKMVEEEKVRAVEEEFRAVPSLYIADGHHRACGASRARKILGGADPAAPWNRFLVVVFPDTQLAIRSYNRLVTHLNGLSPGEFLRRIRTSFHVSPAPEAEPARRREFRLFLGGAWYALTPRPGTFPADDPVGSLDVSILHENILRAVLGIADLRRDSSVEFVGGTVNPGELSRRVSGGAYAAAFVLHPPSIEELVRVADAGKIMPPKSTWFYPKPYSGMVVHVFDDTEEA